MYTRKSTPHDRGKSLTMLRPNDTVRVKGPRQRRWTERATVVRQSGPRSYDVQCEDGRVMRRNRQHLLSTREEYRPHGEDAVTPHGEDAVTPPDRGGSQDSESGPATATVTEDAQGTETTDADEVETQFPSLHGKQYEESGVVGNQFPQVSCFEAMAVQYWAFRLRAAAL